MIDNQTFKIIDRLRKIVFTQRGISNFEPNGAIACPIAKLLQSLWMRSAQVLRKFERRNFINDSLI